MEEEVAGEEGEGEGGEGRGRGRGLHVEVVNIVYVFHDQVVVEDALKDVSSGGGDGGDFGGCGRDDGGGDGRGRGDCGRRA